MRQQSLRLNGYSTEKRLLQMAYFSDSNILEILPSAVYVCNAEGVIINYNRKAAEFWGRKPIKGDENERYCGALKLYHSNGEYLPHNQTPVAACLKSGLPYENLEVFIERPDRSRLLARVNIVPIKDEDGKVLGMINCLYDITKEKETHKELAHKTKELQDYVNNAAIGLHWVDSNGYIKWANKAELDMLGYNEEEYIGHHISEFHADQEKINDILDRLSCNETLTGYEATLRCKNGSIKTVHISSNVFWDEGKFVHTRCFTIDVTEQKRLFNELEKSKARYSTLVHSLETPLYTTDATGRITLFNKAASDLWGREPEIGKDLWCGSYKIFNSDGTNLPLEECPMAVCLKEQRPVYGEEILVVRPDGSIRNVAPHPQPLFDESGNMIGAINMLVDITNIKKTEQALRESEKKYRELAASLERKVEEKTKKLKEYTIRLEFQNKELEQFAYAASHDMKEPLRKIHLYNSSIVENPANILDEKSKDYLNRSVNAAKRMSTLIEDLLTYSKTTATLESFEEVNLNEVVEEIILMYKEEFEQNKVIIEMDKLPVIFAIPFQVKQLMFNLFNNSIKYHHPDRGVCIQIRTEIMDGSEIDDREAESNRVYDKISVIDNGIGFPPQYEDKIFNIFQRLNNLPGAKGSGIGLAICKRIAQNHNGFIKAIGEENKGARFDIYIPKQ